MFNKIRRVIGVPFIIVSGVVFGIIIWAAYGKDDLLRFCDWLSEQARAFRLTEQVSNKRRRDV